MSWKVHIITKSWSFFDSQIFMFFLDFPWIFFDAIIICWLICWELIVELSNWAGSSEQASLRLSALVWRKQSYSIIKVDLDTHWFYNIWLFISICVILDNFRSGYTGCAHSSWPLVQNKKHLIKKNLKTTNLKQSSKIFEMNMKSVAFLKMVVFL